MIRLTDIHKSFNGRAVLRDVNLELEDGKTHVFLGESGCGKSTLLKAIMGLVWPERGRAHVSGRDVSPDNCRAVRRQIGYVPQHSGLFPHFTGWRNAQLVAELEGWPAEKTERRISELAALTGLKPAVLGQYPRQLSGGERQRVSLMRALMLNPPVLLLDEPLGALDPIIRNRLQQDLLGIFEGLRKTVVLVTHDIRETACLADTVTLFNRGSVAQHGALEELLDAPREPFVTEFIDAQAPPPVLAGRK